MKIDKNRMAKIPSELQDLVPYYHDIELGEGFNTSPGNYRIANAINLFFPHLIKLCGGTLKGKRVLDVACNCGGFSFAAARFGATEVVGIDSREIHIQQAERIKQYLGLENISFYQDRIEDLTPDKYGEFDVCILAGIIYHLQDPIGAMRKVSTITKEMIMIDSHVHYSSNPSEEDIPSWWMLTDTDLNEFDGLYVDHPRLNIENYKEFEEKNPVDYQLLDNQFKPSPHTARDMKFSRSINPNPASSVPVYDALCTQETGSLSLVPNKKALTKLMRYCGFEDILEVIPHRFSEEIYTKKIRVGLFGLKREEGGYFPQSVWGQTNE